MALVGVVGDRATAHTTAAKKSQRRHSAPKLLGRLRCTRLHWVQFIGRRPEDVKLLDVGHERDAAAPFAVLCKEGERIRISAAL